MGKPSKNQRVASDRPVIKELPGKAVMYIGSGGTKMQCPTCQTGVTRAIVWEDAGKMYCSRGCIPKKVDA